MNFSSKVYIITGSSLGMGRSCCMKLIEAKAYVIGIDVNDSTIENDSYTHYKSSVLDEKKIEECVKEIILRFGHIDGLVNAAGVFANIM